MWDWSLLLAPWKDSNGGFCPKKKMRTKCEQTLDQERKGQTESCHPLHHFVPVLQQSPGPRKHHQT